MDHDLRRPLAARLDRPASRAASPFLHIVQNSIGGSLPAESRGVHATSSGDRELVTGCIGGELIACRASQNVLRGWVEGVMAAFNMRKA